MVHCPRVSTSSTDVKSSSSNTPLKKTTTMKKQYISPAIDIQQLPPIALLTASTATFEEDLDELEIIEDEQLIL